MGVKTSLQEKLIIMMSSSTYTTIFLIFLIASPILAAPEIKAVEDRTFCMSNAPTTCANSCAGVVTSRAPKPVLLCVDSGTSTVAFAPTWPPQHAQQQLWQQQQQQQRQQQQRHNRRGNNKNRSSNSRPLETKKSLLALCT